MEGDRSYEDRLLTYAIFYNLLAKSFVPDKDKMIKYLRSLAETSQYLQQEELKQIILETLRLVEIDPDPTSEYFRLFELGVSPPYETVYTSSSRGTVTSEKADVAGFYKAFGVKSLGEYPDHIAAELEFLSLLLLKEAYAMRNRDEENAKICREARVEFYRQHIARWAHLFNQSIEKNAKKPTYIYLSRLLVKALELIEPDSKESGLSKNNAPEK